MVMSVKNITYNTVKFDELVIVFFSFFFPIASKNSIDIILIDVFFHLIYESDIKNS